MNEKADKGGANSIAIPKRTFTTEFFVGVFALIGIAAAGYQAMGLGGFSLFPDDTYQVNAEFDNVSGLQVGAPVEIAGVPIGSVTDITLKDPQAIVIMNLKHSIKIYEDDIAAIRTKGIIGDRYVKVSRGASDIEVKPNGTMLETESVVDIEDIIGKIVHSIGGDDETEL